MTAIDFRLLLGERFEDTIVPEATRMWRVDEGRSSTQTIAQRDR